MPPRAPARPRLPSQMEACATALLDELQLAQTWSRPSLLFAVQRSPADQPRAMQVMRDLLAEHAIPVITIIPAETQPNLLLELSSRPEAAACVFFIRRLGTQTQLYDGLNLHRERIVEARLKLTLWLTRDELTLLARRAPDFWAFRHRVIEFPATRRKPQVIPSGALCWHTDDDDAPQPETALRTELSAQEALLASLPYTSETLSIYANLTLKIARHHWRLGDSRKAQQILEPAIQSLIATPLQTLRASLLNALAIVQYDLGEFTSALTSVETALTADESHGWLWANLGLIAYAARQGRRSASALKKAHRTGAASPAVWEALGFIRFAQGEFKPALDAFEQALALHSIHPWAWPMTILCRQQLGEVVDAQPLDQYLAETIDLAGSHDPARHFISTHRQPAYEHDQQPVTH